MLDTRLLRVGVDRRRRRGIRFCRVDPVGVRSCVRSGPPFFDARRRMLRTMPKPKSSTSRTPMIRAPMPSQSACTSTVTAVGVPIFTPVGLRSCSVRITCPFPSLALTGTSTVARESGWMRLVASSSISSRLFDGEALSTIVTASFVRPLLTVNGIDPWALTRLTFSVGRIFTESRVLNDARSLFETALAQSLRGSSQETASRVSSWARFCPVMVVGSSRIVAKSSMRVLVSRRPLMPVIRAAALGLVLHREAGRRRARQDLRERDGVAHGEVRIARSVRSSCVPLDGQERPSVTTRLRCVPPSSLTRPSWAFTFDIAAFQLASSVAVAASRSAWRCRNRLRAPCRR